MAEPRAAGVIAAFLRRSFLESLSQLTPTVLQVFSLGLGLTSQAFLARLVDATPNQQLGAYAGRFGTFVLLGVCLFDLQTSVVGGLARKIREAQLHGQLEALLVTPTPPALILLGLVMPDVLGSFVRLLVYAAVGRLLFGLDFGEVNLLGVAAALACALAAFAAFALLAASLTMLLRRGDVMNLLLASAAMIAGGVFYPRAILPDWLAALGAWLPIAPAVDALRAAVVMGEGPIALAAPLGRLGLLVALVGPAAAWTFARALARARNDGSLTAY